MRQLGSTLLTRKDQEVSAHLLFLGLPNLAMCLKSMPRTQSSAQAWRVSSKQQPSGHKDWVAAFGMGGGRKEKIYMWGGGTPSADEVRVGLQGRCPPGNIGHLPPAGSFLSVAQGRRRGEQGAIDLWEARILTLRPCSLPRERQEQLMGYRKRGPKPKPLVVQVNTLGSQHKPFPGPCSPNYLKFLEGAPQLHLISYRTPGPTPYDAISTCGSWSIPDVPGML